MVTESIQAEEEEVEKKRGQLQIEVEMYNLSI